MDAGTAFSTVHVAVTALLVGLLSFIVMRVAVRATRGTAVLGIVLVSTAATFGWRMSANVGALNDDGIPWVSANDVLAPVVTYVLLGMYATLFPPADASKFEKLRVALSGVALVVNVVAI